MSGSSGGGHNDGASSGGASTGSALGGAGGGGADPCDIVETAPVNSPQPNIIKALSVGDRLLVELAGAAPKRTIQLRANAGIAGSLTHRGALAIASCIDAGNAYEAEVLQLNGGQVLVRIERV